MNHSNFSKTFLGMLLLLPCLFLTAQPPHSFNYQAVLRNTSGEILESQEVTLTLEILKGVENGEVVFTEQHSTQTNAFGLINLAVGSVSSMEEIYWGEDIYFLRISVDGQVMGTSPLLSVPFALSAQTSADAFSGDYYDLENTPDLSNMLVVEDPQEGGLAWFDGTQWKGLASGGEGQVLTIVNGMPGWMDLPEDDEDDPPTATDIDGNIYPVVTINGREWLAENLRTTRYQNGDLLPTGLSDSQWNNTVQGAFSLYPYDLVDGIDSEENMKQAYGLLYNWYATVDPGGLCPAGWHVPTDEEWIELISYMTDNYPDINPTNVGNFVKSCRQIDSPLGGECATDIHPRWNSHHTQYGTDDFGMAALPAGYRNPTGSFAGISNHGGFWTSTEYSAAAAWRRYTGFGHAFVYRDSQLKRLGTSVRCIKTIEDEE
jgi:uncharacterized protein (TIGR02145 family)